MDLNTRKEQFSKAFLRAVGVMADADYLTPEVDRDSIDASLRKVGGQLREQIDVQLKCTDSEVPEAGDLFYDLKLKNYNDLRKDSVVPSFLVVVFVPSNLDEWLDVTEEQMVLKKCGWWVSLKGFPATTNETSVRVSIPRENLLTPQALTNLFNQQSGNVFQPA